MKLPHDYRRTICAEELADYCQYALDNIRERVSNIAEGLHRQDNPVILAESLSILNKVENDLSRVAEALGSAPWTAARKRT